MSIFHEKNTHFGQKIHKFYKFYWKKKRSFGERLSKIGCELFKKRSLGDSERKKKRGVNEPESEFK